MRSEVGEAELNYGYPRFPISTSAPRLSYLAPKHVKETLYVKTSLKETECRSRIFQDGTSTMVSGEATKLRKVTGGSDWSTV